MSMYDIIPNISLDSLSMVYIALFFLNVTILNIYLLLNITYLSSVRGGNRIKLRNWAKWETH